RLALANKDLGPRGVAALCTSPVFEKLTWLDLRNSGLQGAGFQPLLSWLLSALGRSRLRWLDLHGNDLGPATVKLLADWSEQRAGTCGRHFTNSIGMHFRLIPAGTFWMGSQQAEAQRYDDAGPRHEVTLSRPFYLGAYAVTQRQYEWVMGANPSRFRGAPDAFNPPVESASWLDAVEFCRRLS